MPSERNYEGVWAASHRDNTTALGSKSDMADVFGKVQSHDEDTQGSGSGSGYSDLSALENETDDFGRRLLQHQRDTARLKALSGNQQGFRKARTEPRIADLLAREEREATRRDVKHEPMLGNGGGQELDPPVTVPREWGRKARKQPDWMRKTIELSEPSENGDAALNGRSGAIFTHKTAFTGDAVRKPSGDELLTSMDQTPALRDPQPSTPPSSMRHMNTTLRHDMFSEDHDFSSVSLLTSTPAARRLPRKIDELAQQAVEDGERIIESLPNGTHRRSSNPIIHDRVHPDNMQHPNPGVSRPATSHGATSTTGRIPRRQHSPDKNQENVPPAGGAKSAVGNDKDRRTESLVNRSAQALSSRPAQRPTHQRNDSMSLLRKLARVSSMSPSPANMKTKDAVGAGKKSESDPHVPQTRAEQAHSNHANGPQGAACAPEAARPNSGFQREPVPEVIDVDQVLDEILKQSQSPEAKTPVVTGAWVDITLHLVDEALRGTAIPRPKSKAEKLPRKDPIAVGIDLRRVNSEPAHTKSALADILRANQGDQQSPNYGESTIQSLEDIVHPDLEPTDPTVTTELEAAQDHEAPNDDHPLTQDERNRRQESLAIEGMNKHLRSARTNIKDASRGLRRVEHRIETTQEIVLPSAVAETMVEVNRPARFGFTPCETCGGCYHSVWHALWSEFRSCFYTWDPKYKYRIRPTALGLLCAGWLLWYILECWMCALYCRPFVTSRNFANIDPQAPRYPFVIPTLLFRPLVKWGVGEKTYNYMWQALEAWWHKEVFERFITGGDPCWNMPPSMCAYPRIKLQPKTTVRSAFETVRTSRNEWIAAATATVARVSRSVIDVLDEAGSMWDDVEMNSR